jgi:dihydrofolate synthase/folylpolyglutamate synthase
VSHVVTSRAIAGQGAEAEAGHEGIVDDAPVPSMETAWAWLTGLSGRGIQLGLERVRAALARLGDPHVGLVAVTVAGTNGKGSTSSFLASILHEAGYRVGLYTSPHLVSPTERIRIGGHTILASDFARIAFVVRDAMERAPEVPLTLFEVLTVMALVYFKERQIDVAVLEVGLGGRLDATNVVDAKVAVLCPVGLDHQELLGRTKALIAAEKVAVLKPGATLVCAVTPSLWREVVGPYAFELRAPARRLGVDFVGTFEEDGFRYRGAMHRVGAVSLGIRGVHQGQNAALACAAAEALQDFGFHIRSHHLAEGLYRARHRGRMERIEARADGEWPATLIDGAHNPMGARVLARHVEAFLPERPRVMLYGVNPEKDVKAMLAVLVPEVDAVVLTQSSARAVPDFARFVRWVRRARAKKGGRELTVLVEAQAADALEVARALAGHEGGLLVTGSLYLIGDLLPLIG